MTQWFTESFKAEYEKQAAELGRVNIAVFGKPESTGLVAVR